MSSGTETFDYLEPPQLPEEIGRLGAYRILSAIGRGGMGQVFRAEDTRLERIVALKVMHKRFTNTAQSRKRFIHEARAMAAIRHDNVVTVFEVGETAGMPFLAMELLRGHSLEKVTQENVQLSFDEIFSYARQIASGLAAAHARGIVHRDIKPANIWIEEPTGRVKILDFGLALAIGPSDSLSSRGAVVGTPGYLSPEQAQSEPLDDRSDLYSVGVVLYELCCGRLPFPAKTVPEQLIKIIAHVPERPDEINKNLPRPYADLIMQLIAKEPCERIRSAKKLEAVVEETMKAINDHSRAAMQIVTASPPSSAANPQTTNSKSKSSKHPNKALIWGSLASASVMLVIGLWFLLNQRKIANKPMDIKKPVVERAILASTLRPLQLGDVAGSVAVPMGQPARFKVQLNNTSVDRTADPRVIYSRAKFIAQVRAYIERDRELRRPAPAFPRKLSPAQLPAMSQTGTVEIQFGTDALPLGDYNVTFELQSPEGAVVHQVTSQFSIVENLVSGELLGFQTQRVGQGRGGDTFVRKGSDEDFGGRAFVSTHLHTVNNEPTLEHTYLRFDLSGLIPSDAQLDRAVLLLTVAKDSFQGRSTLNAYGISEGLAADWVEKGDAHLSWSTSPSAMNTESLPFLGQVEFDNIGGSRDDQPDQIRIFGSALDDYVRQAKDTVTLLLVRTSSGDKPTLFVSREGKPEHAAGLAIRVKPSSP